jgi:hypothetical protein
MFPLYKVGLNLRMQVSDGKLSALASLMFCQIHCGVRMQAARLFITSEWLHACPVMVTKPGLPI